MKQNLIKQVMLTIGPTNDAFTAEPVSMMLSKTRETYIEPMVVVGIFEILAKEGIMSVGAPDYDTPQTAYSVYRLTQAGKERINDLREKAWDETSFQLWLRSDSA